MWLYSEGKVSVIAKPRNGVWPRPHPLIQLEDSQKHHTDGSFCLFPLTLISIKQKLTLSACSNLYLLLHLRRKTFFLSYFNIVEITGVYLRCRC